MLVTGGGAGLGAAISQAVSSAGGAVAVIDSRAESAQNIARSITANGGIALAVEADVTDPVAMEEAVAAVMERFGRLTGLVNNAGTTRRGTVVDGAADDWDLVMATNYSGTLNASRAAHAALRDVGGSVVNVTSVSSPPPQSRPHRLFAFEGRRRGADRSACPRVGPGRHSRQRGRTRRDERHTALGTRILSPAGASRCSASTAADGSPRRRGERRRVSSVGSGFVRDGSGARRRRRMGDLAGFVFARHRPMTTDCRPAWALHRRAG